MGEALKNKSTDKALLKKLLDLKELVENLSRQPDIALRGSVYREMAKADIMIVRHDNWTIGYKVIHGTVSTLKRIFIKTEGYKLGEIPDIEASPIMIAIFDIFLDRQEQAPTIDLIATNALRIEQICVPLISRMPITGKGMQS